MAFGTVVGAMVVVSAPQVSADPVGPMATAEFGIAFRDHNANGQCRLVTNSASQNQEWVPEGTWTTRIAIDTDNRPGGCDMQFGLNNVDGSLTGLNLTYWFNPPGTGQCGGTANNAQIPYFPFPASLRTFFMSPIVINTDNRQGGCELNFVISGRDDIGLDVRYEYNGNKDQCHTEQPLGVDDPTFTVRDGVGGTLIFDTDNRGGACFLAFRLRHL